MNRPFELKKKISLCLDFRLAMFQNNRVRISEGLLYGLKIVNDIHSNIGDHKHSTRTSRVWYTLSMRAHSDVIHLVLWIQECGFSETMLWSQPGTLKVRK